MAIRSFIQNIQSKKATNVLITSHENVDPDGLSASIAIAKWLEGTWKCRTTVSFNSLNKLSANLVKKFKLKITHPPKPQQYDGVCVVDMSSINQVGNVQNLMPEHVPLSISIDHHHTEEEKKDFFDFVLIDTEVSSTAEIVTQIFIEDKYTPPKIHATLLLVGLLYDSRRFLNSKPSVFPLVETLLSWGADYEMALSVLQSKMGRSEVIARIKAAQRMRRHEIGDFIVLTAKIGSFEASACRGLLDLGADIAIVYSEKPDSVRFSARSRRDVYNKTGLDLARDIMIPVGEIIGGAGGGHSIAAGANGKIKARQGINKAIKLITEKLKQKTDLKNGGL
ncbi:MAG: DHH family phosphoesterase [Candidatus Ranarchaeia archaeon]